jgi:hypothetical protein
VKTGNVSQKSSEHRIKLSACIVSDFDGLQQARFCNNTPSTILQHAGSSFSLISCSRERDCLPRTMAPNGRKHSCRNSSPLSSHLISNLLAISCRPSHRELQSDELSPLRRVKSIRIIFAIAGISAANSNTISASSVLLTISPNIIEPFFPPDLPQIRAIQGTHLCHHSAHHRHQGQSHRLQSGQVSFQYMYVDYRNQLLSCRSSHHALMPLYNFQSGKLVSLAHYLSSNSDAHQMQTNRFVWQYLRCIHQFQTAANGLRT